MSGRPELPPGWVDDPPAGYDDGRGLGQICRQLPNGGLLAGTFYGPRATETRAAAVREAWACYQDVGGWVEYADGLAAELDAALAEVARLKAAVAPVFELLDRLASMPAPPLSEIPKVET